MRNQIKCSHASTLQKAKHNLEDDHLQDRNNNTLPESITNHLRVETIPTIIMIMCDENLFKPIEKQQTNMNVTKDIMGMYKSGACMLLRGDEYPMCAIEEVPSS